MHTMFKYSEFLCEARTVLYPEGLQGDCAVGPTAELPL